MKNKKSKWTQLELDLPGQTIETLTTPGYIHYKPNGEPYRSKCSPNNIIEFNEPQTDINKEYEEHLKRQQLFTRNRYKNDIKNR